VFTVSVDRRMWIGPVNTGVILDTRVDGPYSHAPVYTNREHGPQTRVVCADPTVFEGLSVSQFLGSLTKMSHSW